MPKKGNTAKAKPPAGVKLVGRAEEITYLQSKAEEASKGTGRCVLLLGEAGIGKTALALELEGIAKEDLSFECLYGKCQDSETPFMPWAEALGKIDLAKPLFGGGEKKDHREKRGPYGAEDTPQLKEARFLLFESVADVIRKRAERSPHLIIIDDLQWADASSRELFYYVARNTISSKVLLLGIYRIEELDKDSTDLMERMSREGLMETRHVERLGKVDVRDMIMDRYGAAPETFVDAVYSKTEGNPFFVNELMSTLEAKKAIDPEVISSLSKVDLKDIEAIPQSIRDVITRRLRGLDEGLYHILELMSVIGNSADHAMLQKMMEKRPMASADRGGLETRIQEILAKDPANAPRLIIDLMTGQTGYDASRMAEAMRRLIELHLVKEDGAYRFSNVLIREVVYDRIPLSARPEMHALTGAVMEEVYSDELEKHAERIAHQYVKARDPKRAVMYSVISGDKAVRLHSPEGALMHYENALQFLEPGPQRMDILNKIISMSESLGWTSTMPFIEEFIKTGTTDKGALCRAQRVYGYLLAENESHQDQGLEHIEAALKISDVIQMQRPQCLRDKAEVLRRKGDYDGARVCLEKAVSLTKAEQPEGARIRMALGTLLMYMGRYAESISYMVPSIKTLEGVGQFDSLPMGYNNTAVTLKDMGKLDEAIPYFEKSIASGQRIGHEIVKMYAHSNLSDLYAKRFRRSGNKEDLTRCLEAARTTESLAVRLGLKKMVSVVDGLFGLGYGYKKELERSIEAFSRALYFLKGSGEWSLYADILYDRSVIHGYNGNTSKQREDLKEAIAVFRRIGANSRADAIEKELKGLL